MEVIDNEVPEKLSHSHPLFLNANDNSVAVLFSLRLRESKNYSAWSRAMQIAILGLNKLGFIDGTYKKENNSRNLADLWSDERSCVIIDNELCFTRIAQCNRLLFKCHCSQK